VLIDPMPSRSGLVPASQEFLSALREFTAKHGILLVFDEVISFRMGYRGAQGELGAVPDLTAIAKIIGGGFPIGAVAGRAAIMNVFDPRKGKPAVPHGGTFNANPISMVAGEVAMTLMTPEAFDGLAVLGERARAGLTRAFVAAKLPGQVTGYGSLFRFHMTARPLYDYRSSTSVGNEAADRKAVIDYLYDHGFMLGDTGFGAISTVMTVAEIDALINAFTAALKSLHLASAAD
jgi:glutamate-1-semialdehyde 2,1-aminomutase